MGKLKPVIIFSAIGFVLSFLIGLISGVVFWRIIIRAVIATVACGGFYFLIKLLLKNQLPELFTDVLEIEKNEDSGKGQKLDIVIDDENNDDQDIEDATVLDNFEEQDNEVAENIDTSSFADDITPLDEVSSDFPDSIPVNPTEQSPEANVLDELPNLDAFETNFLDTSSSETTADLVEAGSGHLKNNENADFNSENISNMAKAIHTVLKKDST